MRFAFIAVILLATLVGVMPGQAEKRIALVVGNSAYRNISPLKNSKNDARLIAATLRDLGFSLVGGGAQLDLDKAGIDRLVQTFGRALEGADIGLFYYAGHGVQVRGANYIVPVDANPGREADIELETLDADKVLRQMEASGTKLNLVLLDACRNNPFRSVSRGDNRGVAPMQAPQLISFAAQPGGTAQDGSGDNSPYTKALAAAIRKPGVDLFKTFKQVGLEVSRVTGGMQVPWMSNSPIDGEFYFTAPSSPIQTVLVVPPVAPPTAAGPCGGASASTHF